MEQMSRRQRRPALAWSMLSLMALLAACSHTPTPPREVADAVAAPLKDLNLVNAAIPAVLVRAQQAPYAVPAAPVCASLGDELRALDEALGPDLDAPTTPGNRGLIERGSEAAADAAVGALRRTAEDVVPFRGWVRKLSGAERHSRQVAAAIAAGTVRRGFLKGVKVATGC